MKNLNLLLLLFTSIIFSCADPCEDINCGENGTCNEGICICDDGAYGDNCELFYRDIFISDYSTVIQSCDVGIALPAVYSFTEGANINEIEITSSITPDLLLIGMVDVETITIEPQVQLLGVSSIIFSGSAVINPNNTLDLTLVQEVAGQPTRTCVYTIQRQ